MYKQLKTSFLFTFISTIGLGVVYPAALTGIGFFISSPRLALFKESTHDKDLFHGRPSMSGGPYSGASNLSLTNPELWKQAEERLIQESQQNKNASVAMELLFASASGYDPHLSPQSVLDQVPHIAQAQNLSVCVLKKLVDHHTRRKLWGFIGVEHVNVAALNEELEALIKATKP